MINVGVRNDDLLYLQIVFLDQGENVVNVIARIDDHGLVRSFVADNRAVALERTDGNNFVDHRSIVASA
jgi:hypothetical protein